MTLSTPVPPWLSRSERLSITRSPMNASTDKILYLLKMSSIPRSAPLSKTGATP